MLTTTKVRRLHGAATLLVLISVLASSSAGAQELYPVKPIRIVLPVAPGGGTDQLARMIGQQFSERWGRPAVVENRPGAGTIIASEVVAKSKPDGYTLLVTTSTHTMNRLVTKKMPYDTLRDFAPITQCLSLPSLLVAHPSFARSVKEVIAITVSGISSSVPLVRAGRLRALGATSARRSPAAPDVPTIAEAGVPGYEAMQWYGLLAPAGTPRDIIALLHKETVAMLRVPATVERLGADGSEVVAGTPEAFGELIKSEMGKWAGVAKTAGLHAE